MDTTVRDELVDMVDQALSPIARDALIGTHRLEQEVGWLMQRAVAIARRDGFEWSAIGRLLGRSRQAVRQRFAAVVPTLPPSRRRRRDVLEQQRQKIRSSLADVRRAHESGDDDVVAW